MSPKKVAWRRVTSSRLISNFPGYVVFVSVTSTGPGKARVSLYDGHNTTGEKILTVHATAEDTRQISPPVPIYFSRGCYASVSGDVDSVTIGFLVDVEDE